MLPAPFAASGISGVTITMVTSGVTRVTSGVTMVTSGVTMVKIATSGLPWLLWLLVR